LPKKGSTQKPDTDPDLSENSQTDESSGENASDKQPADNEEIKDEQDRTAFNSAVESSMRIASESDRDAVIGKTLHGKYQILELLGAGGMSRVYKAQQTLTRKVVALKLLHKHLSSNPTMMRRFQAEAQASHHLAHPHIITVYDFGLTEENQPFIIMDYLEGRALSDIVRTWGQLSIDRCLSIAKQILDALEHAHESGVLHRDLKPSNIVLIPSGDNTDYVKLVDFGIAKILPKAGLEAQELTQSGDVFGSPLYMSPEQCLGKMTDVRSDIYAVGCLLYECLTGKPPLIGNNTLETMHKQVSEMPSGLANVKADVRLVKQLEDIVFKAMAKEPENRFQSAQEMSRAIEQTQSEWQGGSAAAAYMRRYSSKLDRLFQNKLGKRWRSKVIVTALLAAFILHYSVTLSILYLPGSMPELSQRIIPWSATEQTLYKIVAQEKMQRIRPITDASDTDELALLSEQISEMGSSQSGKFRIMFYKGIYQLDSGDFDSAYSNLQQAIAMSEAVGMSDSMDIGFVHLAMAACLYELHRLRNAKDDSLLRDALNETRLAAFVFTSASQMKPVAMAKCLEGEVSHRLGKPIEALIAYRLVATETCSSINGKINKQREREKLPRNAPIVFRWADVNQNFMSYQLSSMGNFFLENNESVGALEFVMPEDSLPYEQVTVPGLPSRSKLHDMAFSRGKLVPRSVLYKKLVLSYLIDAEETYQLLVNMCEQLGAGRGALTTAIARANLGMARLKKGLALRDLSIEKLRERKFDQYGPLSEEARARFTDAVSELELARRALELHFGTNHKYLAYALLNLSDAQMNLGQFNEGLASRSEAHAILGRAAR
jgi:serine/threonine protein kinase